MPILLLQGVVVAVLARTNPHLTLERPREVRKVIKTDRVGDFFGQHITRTELFASALQPVVHQILSEAHALLMLENTAKLGRAKPAQGGNLIQRNFAAELLCHVPDHGVRSLQSAGTVQSTRWIE